MRIGLAYSGPGAALSGILRSTFCRPLAADPTCAGALERPLLVLLAATGAGSAAGVPERREPVSRARLRAAEGDGVVPGAWARRAAASFVSCWCRAACVAVGGALLGLAVAPIVARTLLVVSASGIAGVDLSPQIEPQVFVFALAAALMTALLFGLAPALPHRAREAVARAEGGVGDDRRRHRAPARCW